MRTIYISLIAILALVLTFCSDRSGAVKTPNILFILADDFGWNDVSYNSSDYYETPNIDALAKSGVIFTQGYAGCQVCSPSRATIMTGKFPARHGITDWIGAKTGEEWRKQNRFNKLLPPEYNMHLPFEDVCLAEAFQEAGYKTFFAGKWHLGGVAENSLPTDHGFDINKGGWKVGSPMGGYFAPWNNPYLDPKKDGENLSMRLAIETADFMSSYHPDSTGRPFFAFLSFYAVHSPIQTTREKWKKYRDKAVEAGLTEKAYEMGHFLPIRQVQDNPVYGGLVESMDDAIGYVLNTLERKGLAENTIVVFTSDNGGVAAGDAFSTSNLPLRAGKGYQYEGGIREPYIIRVPWLTNRPETCDVPVSGSDFYPTLLDLAGLELKPEQHVDGLSLLPLLKGEEIADRFLVWHYPHYGNQGGEPSSIIREGDWKLIHYYEDGREELFNLGNDPSEQNNSIASHEDIASDLSKKLFDYLEEVGARFPKKDPLYNAEREAEYLKRIREVKLPQLEAHRLDLLSKDFDPGNDWWGSAVKDMKQD